MSSLKPGTVIYSTGSAEPRERSERTQRKTGEENRGTANNDVHDKSPSSYGRQSAVLGDVGMDFMNGDMDYSDDSDDEEGSPFASSQAMARDYEASSPSPSERASSPLMPPGLPVPAHHASVQSPIPIAAPRPGYAAPIAALNGSARSPAPGTPVGRMPSPQMAHVGMSVTIPQAAYMPPSSMPGTPVTPVPLSAPITPITPAFARPPKSPSQRDVKFTAPILRGNSEETLLPKRGEKGDDFWRRFSMVVKVDTTTKNEPSAWLKKTQSGSARMSRWVWVLGWLLLLAIGGAIGVGWYFSHKTTGQTMPKALGGSAGDGALSVSSTTKTVSSSLAAGVAGAGSIPHVTPTNTVQKRFIAIETDTLTFPVPTPLSPGVQPPRLHHRSRRQLFLH